MKRSYLPARMHIWLTLLQTNIHNFCWHSLSETQFYFNKFFANSPTIMQNIKTYSLKAYSKCAVLNKF